MYVQSLLPCQSLLCLAGYEAGLCFKKVLHMNIAKIMIPKVCTVVLHERSTIRQGLEVLAHCHYMAIPVLDAEEHYVGSVTEGDFLRHILKTGTTDMKEQERYSVRDILRRHFCPALSIEAEFDVMVDASLRQNFVPVVDSRNALYGIFTRRSLIAEIAASKK